MFSKEEKKEITRSDIPSIIAPDLTINGDIKSLGSIEIEGIVEGNIICEEITIRNNGYVKGDIACNSSHIDGQIEGTIKGKNISISETGKIVGVVKYVSLSIQDGALIDGQCKNIKADDIEKEFKKLAEPEENKEKKTDKKRNKKDKPESEN